MSTEGTLGRPGETPGSVRRERGTEQARQGRGTGPAQRDRGWGTAQRDRGSGTVLVVGAMGLVLALVVGALGVVSAVVAAHRAQSAADLSALAAAAALARGEAPVVACDTAGRVAGRGGATLTGCRAGADLRVEVVVQVGASVAPVGVARARSRAGPAP